MKRMLSIIWKKNNNSFGCVNEMQCLYSDLIRLNILKSDVDLVTTDLTFGSLKRGDYLHQNDFYLMGESSYGNITKINISYFQELYKLQHKDFVSILSTYETNSKDKMNFA